MIIIQDRKISSDLFTDISINIESLKKLKISLSSEKPQKLVSIHGIHYHALSEITDFVFYAPNKNGHELEIRIWLPSGQNNNTYLSCDYPLSFIADHFYSSLKGLPLNCFYQLVDRTTGEITTTPYDECLTAGYMGNIAKIVNHDSFKWPETELDYLLSGMKIPRHINKIHVGSATSEGTFAGLNAQFENMIITNDKLLEIIYPLISANELFTRLVKNGYLTQDGIVTSKYRYEKITHLEEFLLLLENFYCEEIINITSEKYIFSIITLFDKALESAELLDFDSIEFMPIHEISGSSNLIVSIDDGVLTISKKPQKAIQGWGYDILDYYLSINADYGSADVLKKFIANMHSLGKKVGIDVVFNHLGPDGSTRNNFFNITDIHKSTEWGPGINFSDLYVREWIKESLKRFVELYHIDFVRMDQTSKFGDDSMVFELAEITPAYVINGTFIEPQPIFSIAEDERESISRTMDPFGNRRPATPVSARWDFDYVHSIEELFNNYSSSGNINMDIVEKLTYKLFDNEHSVLYGQSHDEQGNHSGWQLRQVKIALMLIFGRGTRMTFDKGFWHFTRDTWGNVAADLALFAQKSGLFLSPEFDNDNWFYIVETYPETISGFNKAIDILSKNSVIIPNITNIVDFNQFKKFIEFFHKEYCLYGGNYEQIIKKIEHTLMINQSCIDAAKMMFVTYMELISNLNSDKNFNPAPETYKYACHLERELINRYPWLGPNDSIGDKINIDKNSKVVTITRANPNNVDNEQVILMSNFSNQERVIKMCSGDGNWIANYFESAPEGFVARQQVLNNDNGKINIKLAPFSDIILEHVSKSVTSSQTDWVRIWLRYMPLASPRMGRQ
ncbi:MAG: alpha-amylase family glycosyl hydrolase [Spirochaetaceae bacterium]